jgi:RHH-type transcriptional regulator, proline utilization regulon repressor / proline dehydrogenase / delta 1-pyrroline-5-carboxylate dehydrogenase
MIVDSTALPEQAVRDIVASAFRSAGQRCSALRCLYLQEDVAERVLDDARRRDARARSAIRGTGHRRRPIITEPPATTSRPMSRPPAARGRLIAALDAPGQGAFLGPAILRVTGIADLDREVFGPVLHVATFRAADLDRVVDAINATGYGLTFGLHTRIDDRVERRRRAAPVGNIYVNRNQIGAVVGSQPFGGEGLSGTGPKAGGPAYVARFRAVPAVRPRPAAPRRRRRRPRRLAAAVLRPLRDALDRPPAGPHGRDEPPHRPTRAARSSASAPAPRPRARRRAARAAGCPAVEAPGLDADALRDLPGSPSRPSTDRRPRRAPTARRWRSGPGPIVPLARRADLAALCRLERHLCIDTTASGGNATLLAASA